MKNMHEDIFRCLEGVPDDDALLDELIDLVDKATLDDDYILSGRGLFQAPPASKQRTWGAAARRMISTLLFYGILAMVILAAFVYSGGRGEVKNLLGYSYFTVMTKSMQSSIPSGSLIITKQTDVDKLIPGDIITFFAKDHGDTVTHRIVEVIDGGLTFRTKGDDNQAPDSELVPAERVVGKVVFHAKAVGRAMLFTRQRIGWIAAIFLILLALSVTLGWAFRKDDEKPGGEKPRERQKKHYKSSVKPIPIPATGYG